MRCSSILAAFIVACNAITLRNITIDAPGTWGLHVTGDASGAAAAEDVVVTNPGAEGLYNASISWSFVLGSGNSGW